jgi:hypothetical protein
VVNEPVEEGGGDHRVAEDLAPGLELKTDAST